MSKVPPRDLSPSPPPGLVLKAANLLGMLSTFGAVVFMTAMAVRPINSPDIGYHLAYGEHLLDTGHIVQTNLWVYPPLNPEAMKDPASLGPGCRFDAATGTFHFINANWLSQMVMAAAGRKAGMDGLVLLQAALIAMIAVLLVVPMRRNQAPWHWIGPAIVLVAIATDIRMPLRPELFGFLMLVGQWALLSGRDFGWKQAAGVTALQVLAVNFHSYFLLGIALTGAVYAGIALDRWNARRRSRFEAAALSPKLKWLGVAMAGTVVACFANPWFARGAIMPLETLYYMRANNISGELPPGATLHPWATIREFQPLREGWDKMEFRDQFATAAVMILGGLGTLIALLRRHWGWALVIAGMSLVGLQMHRNLAPAAMIVVPAVTVLLCREWATLCRQRLRPGPQAVWSGVALAAVLGLALAGWNLARVVTNQFYLDGNRPTRFGLGCSRLVLPLAAADWIDRCKPAGRIFTPFPSSSNLMYFTHPHRDMPTLSNTWAYPPYLMLQSLLWEAQLPPSQWTISFDEGVRRYDIQTIVLHYPFGATPSPLLNRLVKSSDWALANVGPSHLIFLRRDGQNRELIARNELTESNFDVRDFVSRCEAVDPVPWYSLNKGGGLLAGIGWLDHAAIVFRRSLNLNRNDPYALADLAGTHIQRGMTQFKLGQLSAQQGQAGATERAIREALAQYEQARPLLQQALRLRPGYARALDMQKTIDGVPGALIRRFGRDGSGGGRGAPGTPVPAPF